MLPALQPLARHESPVVRAHAVWAVQRLAGTKAGALLETARAQEEAAIVLEEYAAG